MNIKKIELQGFKSFPDRAKIIFHPGITTIIGPNGTGKSNIVDALIWVLGGKRLRSTRGDRGGDLIFSGSAKRPPLNMADVHLFLADGDEELAINHRAFRTGESEYRMNGKLVRLRDIHDALRKKSIAETEYFVIEQGSIGVFLSAKPTEKRQLLEEAAGTAFYKDKKRQTQNKLENTEQNLIRLEDIIEEVQKAKNSLKRQALSALRYRKLRERIRELTLFHYRRKIGQLEKSHEDAATAFQKSREKETAVLVRLKDEEKKLSFKRQEIWSLDKDLKTGQDSLYSQKSRISQIESEIEKELRRIDFLAEKKAVAERSQEELSQELSELEEEKTSIAQNVEELQASIHQKQKEAAETQSANQGYQKKIQAIQEAIRNLREEHLNKLAAHTEIKNEKAKQDKEMELLLHQETKIRNQLEDSQTSFSKEEKRHTKQQKNIDQARQRIQAIQERLASAEETLKNLVLEIDDLQGRLLTLSREKETNLHHLQALEKLEEKERSEAAAQKIPGSPGLLADLIESEASDAALIDVFWKDEAKSALLKAVNFLRLLKQRGAKGQYLLLHPHKEKTASEVLNDPRVIGTLKARVKPRPGVKNYLAQLEEAVVVQDLGSAVNLWLEHPEHNYITSSGDLLLHSGLLKAGPRKEGMFALRTEIDSLRRKIGLSDNKIAPLEQEVQRKTREKSKLEERIKTETANLVHQEKDLAGKERERTYGQSEKAKAETNLILLQKELSILSEDRQALTKKLQDVSGRIGRLLEEETGLKTRIGRLEEELTSLRQNIEEGRRRFFELRSQIDILKEKTNSLAQRRETINQRKDASTKKIRFLKEEGKAADSESAKAKENIQRLKAQSADLSKAKQSGETALAEKEAHLKELQKEQQDLEKAIEALREEQESSKEARVQREVKKAEVERDLANLEESCWQELKKTLQEVKNEVSTDILPSIDIEETLMEEKDKLQTMKAVNLMAEEEYTTQKNRHDFLVEQKKDLLESIEDTRKAIRKIDKESRAQFQEALVQVNQNIQDIFALLFEGGQAELKLSDPSDPLESGIEIVAQPPGKKLQSLNLLSGGEKSLTSLAFFFALFRYKPTPFCILDEVDAALDEVNLSRFLNLMKKIKDRTQFILITHNFKSMEVADFIYGTTMAEPNITSLYSVKLEKKKASENS